MAALISYARQILEGVITPQHLNAGKFARYTLDKFDAPPAFRDSLGNGNAAGTTGAVNLLITPKGHYEWVVLGAGQTILVPVYDRTNGLGLDFGQDQTATEGHELSFSPNIITAGMSRGKHSYTIGTDKAFFARLKVRAADASGLNPFAFGFIKHGAYQTAIGTYTDFAAFHCQVSGTVADIRQQTRLNSGTAVTVDSTQDWTDNQSRTFEIRVSQTGKVTFLLDNAYPTVPYSGFVFDTGDVVRPAAFFLHGTDLCDNLFYQEFESGLLTERAV